MRVLVITKIFPSSVEPAFAPYNRYQFGELDTLCDVDVLGIIPWFPGASLLHRWSDAGRRIEVPRSETIDRLHVRHPRVLYIPRVGHVFAGATYALSLLPEVVARRGSVDVVLGSFAYPDGWAAVALSRLLGVPAVIKVHGGDINELSKVRVLRPHLRWALSRAAAVVATSRALADAAIAAGARAETTSVIFNGVDLATFRVRDRAEARRELGRPTEGRWILFVGRVEARKGVRELMQAFAGLSPARPDVKLVLVGDGTERTECEAFARERGLPVEFAGARPHDEVAVWLGACDVLALPSHAEGTPNVVVEALVSGRRVVATQVGGIPAVVDRDVLGTLVPSKDAVALEAALASAIDAEYRPQSVAEAVTFGGWRDSAQALHDVLAGAIDRGNPVPHHRGD